MKLRQITLLVIFAAFLSACNFTLAEDVTPPPNYIPPTPMPTLGNLFPEQAPNIANGEAIYIEKCLACHGETGMGDGPQGIQLGVTGTAYGLPEIARAASPAQWYEVVTRGRMDRFMPPFASLNDQERWDVVAYISTLHTTPEKVELGKELFEAKCPDCATGFFANQEKMSALTEVELMRVILNEGSFLKWLEAFLPGLSSGEPKPLFEPAHVSDARDTKWMVVVDGAGVPLGSQLASASPAEVKLAEATLQTISVPARGPGRPRSRPMRVVADRGYDSDPLRWRLLQRGILLLSPHRKKRRRPSLNDGRMMRRYRKRWKVERTFAWLRNFRRLVVRYDRRLDMYRAFFHLACALITLRFLAK